MNIKRRTMARLGSVGAWPGTTGAKNYRDALDTFLPAMPFSSIGEFIRTSGKRAR
jgi:hypothetical protein